MLAALVAISAGLTRPTAAQKLEVNTSVAALEAAAQRDSNDAAALYNLALGYWSKRKWDQVDSALQRALAIDSRFAAAYFARAFLPHAAGRFWEEKIIVLGGGWELHRFTAPDSVVEQFDRQYRRALMIEPLVDIRIQVATEYRSGHIDGFDKALYAYNDGKWEDAYERFGALVGDSASYREEKGKLYEQILWYHGLAAARLQKHDEAIADLRRLITRSENREGSDTLYRWPLRTNEYRYTLAYLTQRAGDANGAVRLYQDALTNDLGLYMAHVRIGDLYEGAGMFDQAITARRNALNANPDDPSLLLDLGKTLANAGRWADAEQPLTESGAANPRDPRVPFYLGTVFKQLGRTGDARVAFTRFIAIAPSRYERQVAVAKQHLAALQ
jgi:tetratricopeptide (TPR) repeat protein